MRQSERFELYDAAITRLVGRRADLPLLLHAARGAGGGVSAPWRAARGRLPGHVPAPDRRAAGRARARRPPARPPSPGRRGRGDRGRPAPRAGSPGGPTTSSCGATTACPPTTWPWSSTTPTRASRRSCGPTTSLTSPRARPTSPIASGCPCRRYAHVPLVLGPDGTRLAKRHGAVTLAELAERGPHGRRRARGLAGEPRPGPAAASPSVTAAGAGRASSTPGRCRPQPWVLGRRPARVTEPHAPSVGWPVMCGRFVSASPPDQIAAYFDASVSESLVGVAAGAELQHGPDQRHLRRGRHARGPPRRGLPLGPRAGLGQGHQARPEDDQRPRRDAGHQERLQAGRSSASAASSRPTASTSGSKPGLVGPKGKPAKQPYFIHRLDGEPLAFAGLWETWRDPDAGPDAPRLHSCTIITTTANDDDGADPRPDAGDPAALGLGRPGSTRPTRTSSS